MATVTACLSFGLAIRTATGSPSYPQMTAAQKAAMADELFDPFTSAAMCSLIESWEALSLTVDATYHDQTDTNLRSFISSQFSSASSTLSAELGSVPALSMAVGGGDEVKHKDCGHRVRRSFALTLGGSAWTRTSSVGVVADIVATLDWTVPGP